MTDSSDKEVNMAVLFFSAISMLLGLVIGIEIGERTAEEALKVEEPKNTQHLHLHMEACDQKDRYGL